VEKISLLPYNGAAGAKYSFVGKKYGLQDLPEYTKKEKAEFLKVFSSLGLAAEVGR
jgi:hypothetical protein